MKVAALAVLVAACGTPHAGEPGATSAGDRAPGEIAATGAKLEQNAAIEGISGEGAMAEAEGATTAETGATPPPPPDVRFEPATITGKLAPAAVLRVLRANQPAIARCWTAGAAREPARFTVTFAVGSDGKVSGATASTAGGAVGECVRTAIARLTFPRPDRGSAGVVQPIAITPAG